MENVTALLWKEKNTQRKSAAHSYFFPQIFCLLSIIRIVFWAVI